jgi:hypothetical protein
MYVKLAFHEQRENIILKWFLLLLISLFLIGCTSAKNEDVLLSFKNYLDYHKILKKTEKIQLYDNNETKVMLTATYLYTPTFENNDTRDEVFVVGIYFEDEIISAKKYHLTLNGKPAKVLKLLDKGDSILENISFITSWGSYYLVTFPHVHRKSFELVFESNDYGKGVLHFSKVAKYTLP